MKILIIGGTGTIGTAVTKQFKPHHDVITVGKNSGDLQADITDDASVLALFEKVGHVDAIIATTGDLHFGAFAETTAEQFNLGLQSKLLGQVRLVLLGQHYLNDGGSITLSSGIVAEEPIRDGANATTVNAAIEGFVRAAAIELPRGIRINAVSPTMLKESEAVYGSFFPGFEAVPASRVVQAYRRSVEGAQTGKVYRVW